MKQLNQYITEYIIKKKLDKPIDSEDHYKYSPETKEELLKNIQELLNNTTSCWATLDDVNGRFFASKKDASKSIFIPAAGAAWYGLTHGSGEASDIWSSMLYVNIGGGQCFYFSSGNALWSASARSFGLSVRGVIG